MSLHNMLNLIISGKLSITDMLNPVILKRIVESPMDVNSIAVNYGLSAINMYNNDFGPDMDGIEAASSVEVMVKQKGRKQLDIALSADKASCYELPYFHIFTSHHILLGACLINQQTVSSSVLSPIILLFIIKAVLMLDTRPTHG